ncbi:DEAD/DEAH box helicase [Cytobacillus praedii]|uniref:DEAD/DEAH box helicase n=1 Tax=Cytobacillus praedii TaxID=1742358 RepID=A0A4R1B0D1_9BACI|nr:DEAD/DEAH box helicase [Cytobacillus praedii]TCJ03439.1 DEAD/DEAH box helicase [Cytobacillus praedii]
MPDFLPLGISSSVSNALQKGSIVKPTPIQGKAIPAILNGKDLIAQSQTGTGKTLAFVLPILEKVNRDTEYIQALIVTPTRELAIQITDEIEKLIKHMDGINVLAVYGGKDVDKQLNKLKNNIQIVVGTPGRLLDHIRRETIQLDKASFLVLDEADQMLHIGFLVEVEEIIKQTPNSRQTLLFSATIPAEIKKLAKKHMNEPEYLQIEKTQGPAVNVKQVAIHTIDRAKQGTLIHLIETHRPFLAVIFCRTKRRVSKLYDVLKINGFTCDELHGDLSQAKRELVMKRFRDAEFQLLIATDIAARGLDIDGVTHVFNYDIPQDAESYVHRIGRTGRAGMKGLAITLYSSADRPTLDLIEKELDITIQKQTTGKIEKKRDNDKNKGARSTTNSHDSKTDKSHQSRKTHKPQKNNSNQKAERKTTRKQKASSSSISLNSPSKGNGRANRSKNRRTR